ncbi:MAG TPA: hypothetical protein VH540_17945 [Ktedonobacterales bacterium]|jgi:hypothetical protein
METFKCPYCGKAHPDTTIFCVQKQKALVKYPTLLLVTLLLLALAAELVTAFTQPDHKDDGSNPLTTVFIYKPWLLYSFLGILLLVWEGSFLRKRPVQRSIAWGVTIAALIIIGLFTAEPQLLTALQNSQLLKDFFKNPWTYIIANLIFVFFWLYQTIRRRLRRDKSGRVQTIFSDTDEEEESPVIAETEYTSGDLLAGALIFLFSAFMFPFLYLVIARYALEAVPAAQAAGQQTLQLTWLLDHFDKMTSLRIGGDAPLHPDDGVGASLALLDLAIAALLFAISTISLLIVTYNEGLQEISAVTSEEQGLLPRHTSELPVIKASDLAQASASSAEGSVAGEHVGLEEAPAESLGEITMPSLTAIGSPEAESTEEDVELAVGKTVARTAIAGLTRALLSLRVVAGSAALSLRSLLWPFSIFVGVAFVAAASGVVYTYLHDPNKFPRYSTGWDSFSAVLSAFLNWLVSWLEICIFGLVALALVTIAIAVFTRARYVLSDAVNFLRWFGLLVVLTYWILAIALLAINATMRLQEFVSIKGLENPWPLALDLTGILSFALFLFLAIPPLIQERRSQKPKNPKAAA